MRQFRLETSANEIHMFLGVSPCLHKKAELRDLNCRRAPSKAARVTWRRVIKCPSLASSKSLYRKRARASCSRQPFGGSALPIQH